MRHRFGTSARLRRLLAALGSAAIFGAALFVHVPAATASPGAQVAISPFYSVHWEAYNYRTFCPAEQVCIWDEISFSLYGIFFGGNYGRCTGWRFEGTVWQDNTFSIRNRATGPISIWNRRGGGSDRYDKYGWLGSEYEWGSTPFSYIMDAWVYDPLNNCRDVDLNLHVVRAPAG